MKRHYSVKTIYKNSDRNDYTVQIFDLRTGQSEKFSVIYDFEDKAYYVAQTFTYIRYWKNSYEDLIKYLSENTGEFLRKVALIKKIGTFEYLIRSIYDDLSNTDTKGRISYKDIFEKLYGYRRRCMLDNIGLSAYEITWCNLMVETVLNEMNKMDDILSDLSRVRKEILLTVV